MTSADTLLRFHAVRYRWRGDAADSLRVPSFEVRRGERVFVCGPSGCGKSTLLGLAAGVLVAGAGSVALDGVDWRSLSAAARDRRRGEQVGYLFQQFNLLPYLSVLDNVLLPMRLSRVRRARVAGDAHALVREAQRWLRVLGLDETLDRRSAQALSVGQQQRVAAARALLGQPPLVIADEPTSALDESARDVFMQALIDACTAAGSAVLFVSHDTRLARYFDRVIDLPALQALAEAA